MQALTAPAAAARAPACGPATTCSRLGAPAASAPRAAPQKLVTAPRAGRARVAVRAALFGGAAGARSSSASPRGAPVERSGLVAREVVLFLLQRELDEQLSRALNYEDGELARAVRAQRQLVDEQLAELRAWKGPGCGAAAAGASAAALDAAPVAFALRARLAAAVAAEAYADAAALRDELAALEAAAGGAGAAAAAAAAAGAAPPPRFALGARVVHAARGYSAVVAGWDVACCEAPVWRARAGVDGLAAGAAQPFYHLLVDAGAWPADADDAPPVAYVAEELLVAADAPEARAPGAPAPPLGAGALQAFSHPYAYQLFLGADGAGGLLPCAQLREKYGVARRDSPPPEEAAAAEEEGEEEGGGAEDGGADAADDSGAWGGGGSIPGIDMRSLE
jgi:hemimethylated DNA binding protein